MTPIPEHLERLMNRRLDGELSAEESLYLDRELMRNAEARGWYDSLRRMDGVCGTVLEQRFGAVRETCVPAERVGGAVSAGRGIGRRRWNRGWLLVPGSIAAALLATVIPFPRLGTERAALEPVPPRMASTLPTPSTPMGMVPYPVASDGGVMRLADWSRPRTLRNTDRGVWGIRQRDGSVLLIEVDRIQMVRAPAEGVVSAPFETY